jgi:Mitogen-activated protein kinase kinase 1 interacting
METISLLPESLQNALESLLYRVNSCGGGIQVVLLSTSEGVSLGRWCLIPHWSDEILSNLESTWAPQGKQIPLLQMGEAKSVTAYYDQLTLMHVYFTPVVVTLLLDPQCNMGAIQSTAIPLMEQLFKPLCTVLLSSLSPETNQS